MSQELWIHYRAAYGQRLQVVIDGVPVDLDWTDEHWWSASVELPPGATRTYRLVADEAIVRAEAGPPRRRAEAPVGATIVDRWQDPDPVRRSRTSALFTRALASRWPEAAPASPGDVVRFRLLEPAVPDGWRPAVVGAAPALGAWDPEDAVTLSPAPYPWWEARVAAPTGTAYKYVLLGPEGQVAWETGADRLLPADLDGPAVVVDEALRGRAGWRGAGVAVPVFALRTDRSLGVGQFSDLVPFVDWAADAGLSLIQLLPLNDTVKTHGWEDSYPYDPVSVHALHPLYLDLADLPGADTVAAELATVRGELEPLPEFDYPRVMAAKWRIARQLFDRSSDAGLDAFIDAEWRWLGPYVRWCLLRDRHGSPDPDDWGDDATHDAERVDALLDPGDPDHDEARFHAWLQWHLRRQLDAVAEHARLRGIALKGDLPIGVSPTSVEVWTRPELFHVGAQTGAPPDAFAEQGQNWGFPTYDWEAMAADGHAWWRGRFAALARTFDAYRIDHVLGFFRIWEIPEGEVDGRLGRFRPCLPLSADEVAGWLGPVDLSPLTARDGDSPDVALLPVDGGWHPRVAWRRTRAWSGLSEDARAAFDAMATDFYHRRHARLWEGRGRATLGAVVTSTDLLACGEDLGMVPDMLPGVLRDLGVLSLEIGRMPKSVDAWRSDPRGVPYLTVVSTGTHDMPPLRGWWGDDPAAAERYWREVLGRGGAPPVDPGPDVCRELVREALASPAMLCVLPIQDLLATRAELRRADPGDEQINRPSDRHHRWRYRLHVTVADLQADRAATEQIREDVRAAGRR